MSRQTLQALSAVPRPRIVQSDQWVQRRKSDVPRGAHDLNYQHWLIQVRTIEISSMFIANGMKLYVGSGAEKN